MTVLSFTVTVTFAPTTASGPLPSDWEECDRILTFGKRSFEVRAETAAPTAPSSPAALPQRSLPVSLSLILTAAT